MTKYVLDASAVISSAMKDAGAAATNKIVNQAHAGQVALYMHRVSLLEVYLYMYRNMGKRKADEVVSGVLSWPIEIISEISDDIFYAVGRFHVNYRMPLGDSVLLATASVIGGTVVTSDHKHMEAVDKKERSIKFLWTK